MKSIRGHNLSNGRAWKHFNGLRQAVSAFSAELSLLQG